MADLGLGTPVSEEESTRSRYLGTVGEEVQAVNPGEHWSVPLQEQHPEVERFKLMNLSATPETMARYLKNQGFEAKHRGGWDFSIRKPGEDKWKVIDPDTWTDMLPFVGGDWSDVIGDVATILGATGGAVAATLPTAVTGPGAVVAGTAGAAGGAAAVEAGKQGLAKLVGLDPTLGEAASRVGEEALYGATGELGGRALGALARSPLGKRALLGAGRARRGVGEVVKRTGGAMEFPLRAAKRGIESAVETASSGVGERAVLKSDRKYVKDLLNRVIEEDQLIAHPDKAVREAALETSDVLSRPLLRTGEIKKTGRSLLKALERTEPPEGLVKEAIGNLENLLPKFPEEFSPFGVKPKYIPEAALIGQATGVASTIPGVAPIAAATALGLAGKGVRAIGLDLMRDTTGKKLRELAAKATGPLARKLGMPLEKLQTSGPTGYKAAVYTMMFQPDVRKWLREQAGVKEEESV